MKREVVERDAMVKSGSASLLLGDLGEDKFKSWCSLSGALATKASPDRMGWDYFVELDPVRNPRRPLDSQGWLPKFFAQVKSTKSKEKSIKIKLSAIKRLVDTDLPAFVFVIIFNQENACTHSYCVHVDNTIIEAVLASVRRNESLGSISISKKYFHLNYRAGIPINLDDPLSFEICRRLADNAEYSLSKADFRKSVGYGADSIKITVGFDARVKHDDVEDMFIGISDELPLKEFRISRERFGISLSNDTEVFGGAILKMMPRFTKAGVVRVSRHSDGLFYDLNCQILVAPFGDPEEGVKFRVFNEHVSIIIDTRLDEFNFNLKIEEKKSISLSELKDLISFINILSGDGAILEIFLDEKLFVAAHSISGVERPYFADSGMHLIDNLEWAAIHSGVREPIILDLTVLNNIFIEKSKFISLMRGNPFFLISETEERLPPEMGPRVILMIYEIIEIQNFKFHIILASLADVEIISEYSLKFVSSGMERLDAFINDRLAANKDLFHRRLEKLCEKKYPKVQLQVMVAANAFHK